MFLVHGALCLLHEVPRTIETYIPDHSSEAGEEAKKAISICEAVKSQLQLLDDDCSDKIGE